MRNKASRFVGIMLLAWVMAGCDEVKLGVTYVRGFISEYVHSAFVEELDEKQIPQVPVEYAGEVGVDLKRTVELAFDEETPGIGRIEWMGITPDNALLLTDQVSGEAHEFSLNDGHHIRSFGRRGKGPGEYGRAQEMAMDSRGDIYIRDARYARLLHYNRQGQYLDDKMRWIGGADLLVDRDDALLLLEEKRGGFLQIRKILGLNGKVEYPLSLFRKKDRFITSIMKYPAQVCYNATLDRVYYLEANDYMVKEVDVGTGKILRQFGALVPRYDVFTLEKRPPPDFRFLPEKYHDLRSGSNRTGTTEIMSQISRANSMTLIEDRYLLISHLFPNTNDWTLYDLASSEPSGVIKAYSLDASAYKSLNGTRYDSQGAVTTESSIDNRISSWQNRLYIFKPVLEERAESSNGTVEIYELSFE